MEIPPPRQGHGSSRSTSCVFIFPHDHYDDNHSNEKKTLPQLKFPATHMEPERNCMDYAQLEVPYEANDL